MYCKDADGFFYLVFTAFFAGFLVAAVTVAFVGCEINRENLRAQALEYNIGSFNPKTGAFEMLPPPTKNGAL